jgi:hypothetical protein
MAGAPESTKFVIEVQLQAEFLHAGIVISRIIQSEVSDFFFDAILFHDSEHRIGNIHLSMSTFLLQRFHRQSA